MRYKATPFNLGSISIILFFLWKHFTIDSDPMGFGALIVSIAITVGLIGFTVDLVIQQVFDKYFRIVLFELAIICLVFLVVYIQIAKLGT